MMKNKKIVIFTMLIIILVLAEQTMHLSGVIEDSMESITYLVNQNFMLAVFLYCILTILGCVVLALPGISFAIAAGVLFGPWIGTLCCSCATTAGAVLAFLAGRYFLKDSMEPIAKKNKYLKKWLFDHNEKNEIFVLMITRLVPLFPYNLQNFAYGITDISLKTYVIASGIFMFPGTAMYTIGAASLTSTEYKIFYIIIAFVLAVGVFGISIFLKKRYFGEENEGRE